MIGYRQPPAEAPAIDLAATFKVGDWVRDDADGIGRVVHDAAQLLDVRFSRVGTKRYARPVAGAIPYSVRRRHAVGEVIAHPTFGPETITLTIARPLLAKARGPKSEVQRVMRLILGWP